MEYYPDFFEPEDLNDADCIESTMLSQTVQQWNQMGFRVVHPIINDDALLSTAIQYGEE